MLIPGVVQTDLLESMQAGFSPNTVEQLTDVEHLKRQLAADDSHFASRFSSISTGLVGVVDDFSLLRLYPLAIEDHESVKQVLELVDQANGFSLSGLAGRNPYEPAVTDVISGSRPHLWDAEPAV